MAASPTNSSPIEQMQVAAYRIPTDAPEADGTIEWQATTLVLVQIDSAGKTGIGYTYADTATATLIHDTLMPLVIGCDALSINECWLRMVRAIRNLGRDGICSMAISAVDIALWDLKGKLLNIALLPLLGASRESIALYGSGGFTSYSLERLKEQLKGWVDQGFSFVKMKVGRDAQLDITRMATVRTSIGDHAQLFIDANGAYTRKQSLYVAEAAADFNVTWFEEPVSSDDLEGLRLLRDRAPANIAIAAGEYGYDQFYFRRMLQAQAVDTLQADATRCGGITGFMAVDALCDGFGIPLSAHCAPTVHAAVGCAARRVIHLEYFYDHQRIEQMLFDGAPSPLHGEFHSSHERPGLGIEFKFKDAECYRQ